MERYNVKKPLTPEELAKKKIDDDAEKIRKLNEKDMKKKNNFQEKLDKKFKVGGNGRNVQENMQLAKDMEKKDEIDQVNIQVEAFKKERKEEWDQILHKNGDLEREKQIEQMEKEIERKEKELEEIEKQKRGEYVYNPDESTLKDEEDNESFEKEKNNKDRLINTDLILGEDITKKEAMLNDRSFSGSETDSEMDEENRGRYKRAYDPSRMEKREKYKNRFALDKSKEDLDKEKKDGKEEGVSEDLGKSKSTKKKKKSDSKKNDFALDKSQEDDDMKKSSKVKRSAINKYQEEDIKTKKDSGKKDANSKSKISKKKNNKNEVWDIPEEDEMDDAMDVTKSNITKSGVTDYDESAQDSNMAKSGKTRLMDDEGYADFRKEKSPKKKKKSSKMDSDEKNTKAKKSRGRANDSDSLIDSNSNTRKLTGSESNYGNSKISKSKQTGSDSYYKDSNTESRSDQYQRDNSVEDSNNTASYSPKKPRKKRTGSYEKTNYIDKSSEEEYDREKKSPSKKSRREKGDRTSKRFE